MKTDFNRFINELRADRRYIPVKEEKMPAGFFSSAEVARRYDIAQRVSQKLIADLMSKGKLEVRFVRRKTNGVFTKKIPVYKFKLKSDEKSFKSRLKGKR